MAKQIGIIFLVLLLIIVGIVGVSVGKSTELTPDSFLRIHIRANSNSDDDQSVKYLVKDAITSYLTPILADATDKQSAILCVSENLDELSKIASTVLENNGYTYGAKAVLRSEYFPTRSYDGVVLESGEYDSLIVELGSAEGNNWWCVVYPPLCFVNTVDDGSQNVVYRSKLVEIINSFFN